MIPVKDILEAFGFTSPFIYGSATFGFFAWLDRNASPQASRAISALLQGLPYSEFDIRSGITAAFDRVYSSPLFRIKAFLRSALISGVIQVVYLSLITRSLTYGLELIYSMVLEIFQGYYEVVWQFVVAGIMSDYISLFVVRRCLTTINMRIALVAIISLVVGISVIMIIICLTAMIGQFVFFAIYTTISKKQLLSGTDIKNLFDWGAIQSPFQTNLRVFMLPPLFVYIWLVLLILAAATVRLFYPILQAVKWAQWFIRQGKQHPLKAIGMVAAVMVFAATAIWRLLLPFI